MRENWIVVGADDGFIRVYNYDTMEMIKEIEAHTDFIRSLAIHPTLPFILSSSDDKLIKLWDWEKGWICSRIFEGHGHYVMQVAFNPKDLNTFASASLDCTIKVPAEDLLIYCKQLLHCFNYFESVVYGLPMSSNFQIWNMDSASPNFTLDAHAKGINCIEFFVAANKPYLISGSDDYTAKVCNQELFL